LAKKRHTIIHISNVSHHLGTGFFVLIHTGFRSVKKIKFISDRISYMTPRDHWRHVTVLNVHALNENGSRNT